MGRRASESSDLTTSNASESFAHQHGVALQTLAPAPAIAASASASAAVSASVSVPDSDSDSVAVPGIPVQSRPHSRSPPRARTSSYSSVSSSSSSSSIIQHDSWPFNLGLDEAVAEPAAASAAMASSSKASNKALAKAKSATATPPLLPHDGHRSESSPYGSMDLTPNRSQSPSGSDSASDRRRRLRQTRSTSRSGLSKRSLASRRSSRRSEDFDGAALVSGLEGRFGMPEALLSTVVLDDEDLTEEDGPLLGDASSASSSTEIPDREAEENSPNEIVRASVSPIDDTTLSINTPRMWCLSILFSILGSSTNLFFSLRYPSVAITPVIALLLVHPLGHLWDYLLKRPYDPEEEFTDGVRTAVSSHSHTGGHDQKKFLTSLRLWLAQGRWNEKEHTCVYVSSNVAFGFAFATDVIVEQTQFYNQDAPIVYQLLLTISTQILGYGFAGMARRFLVRPSGMIWPGTLMSAAMFSTLHKQENKPANGWTISRWKFFYIVWTCASLFYFLPGLLMPALSYFNVITWFAPKSVVLANLFGVSSGLGLFPMTFDWAQITYVGSPLLVPFWAAMNVIGGLAVVMWIIAPLFYYSNVLYASYMPILSAAVFDNTGKVYEVSKILTPNFLFDREAYSNYSRVFLPVTYMLSYGVQFAGLAALLTHTLCWHGQDIWRTWKKSLVEAREQGKEGGYQHVSGSADHLPAGVTQPQGTPRVSSSGSYIGSSHIEGLMSHEDIHSRLMKRYKDAPISWYLLTFVSMAAIGIFVVEYYPVHLPWYGLLLALAIGAIFFIPNGIIMAITNQHSSIYLICQLICGVAFPGRPIANMVFVTYGYISSAQGIKFASDLKLGHYMKIPPRIMFLVQIVATLVSSVTQIGVLNWMFANVKGICTPEAVNGFTCPIARVHFNGSILWGVVGPGEFFGSSAIYRSLVWCFPLGAFLPIPLWLYSRHKKHSFIRKVNLPVIFGAMGWIPPATGLNFSVWALVCFLFNYLIKRRANAWWGKYTMTLSAALDSGLAFGIVIVFFVFIYPGWMKDFSWWGTEVYKQGCDWQACSYRTVKEGEHFGPESW
ncbi:glutathione transporter 1 [Trichoderma asperellum]|uniref:Glutathione transporter 1 n=1 Tax=Trichoderma asperellum TaxID=101201 RepID=A0A6V8QLN1_TRIAP|nr:glutathione transporter 1 [Trichoderma asperellum]